MSQSKKARFCVEAGCNAEATTQGYCRKHYIANWKTIKFSEHVKAERRLNAFVDRLAQKYPKDYMEKIKEGLESEERFKETIQELELEEGEQPETEREYLERLRRNLKISNE